MKFTPKSQEEINAMNLVPAGKYTFQVVLAEDKVSKSGNEMIKLQLKFWDNNGREHTIFDYLLEAMAYKLRHFAEVTGMLEKYNQGMFAANDCLHKSGVVDIAIKPAEQNMGGNYPEKNIVKDYVLMEKKSTNVIKESKNFIDDDVPF